MTGPDQLGIESLFGKIVFGGPLSAGFLRFSMAKQYDTPCGDKTCYRGAIVGWGHHFRDGPCKSQVCEWPKDRPPQPHYTDNPNRLIWDADKSRWYWAWD